jgi:ABC-type transport system substrate-binding protein
MEDSNYWTRLNRRRISRRALLSAGATTALGAAAATVVGCGGGNGNGNGGSSGGDGPVGTSEPQVYGPPVGGGTIVQGRLLNVLGIDPHIDLTGLDIDMRLYSYLYSWKPFEEKAIFNNYALSVETPSPDQTEFIFSLRPDVKTQGRSSYVHRR